MAATHWVGYYDSFPSVDEWRRILPDWFVTACAEERSPDEANAYSRRWRQMSATERADADATRRWSLRDWLYWFDPASNVDRGWEWWSGGVDGVDRFWVEVVVEGDPSPVGTLRWLMRAAGASSVSEEPSRVEPLQG